jgi:hypothetical protein
MRNKNGTHAKTSSLPETKKKVHQCAISNQGCHPYVVVWHKGETAFTRGDSLFRQGEFK